MHNDELTPGYRVEQMRYMYSTTYSMLGIETAPNKVTFDNIGDNGCHLSIALLSMNRAYLTIRCLESIAQEMAGFAGEVVIGDNGSEQAELNKLYEAAKAMPFQVRIIEFGKNFGVAGGRNKLYAEANHDWIMSLDNDLYFTGNPLKQIQEDIAAIGCHFLVLPLLNKDNMNTGIYGGQLYVDLLEGGVSIGLGSSFLCDNAVMNVPGKCFQCTALPGGTAILNKNTFYKVGGFDINMFVGFEDAEFSLRLFQQGYKVGACGMICLIHDHPMPDIQADIGYEQVRFSNDHLRESAAYFEKKHGVTVWNRNVAQWIARRRVEMNVGECEKSAQKYLPRVALVIDRPDWALDHIANECVRYNSDKFEFVRIFGSDIDNLVNIFLAAKDCDIIHFFWRGTLSVFQTDWVQQRITYLGFTKEDFIQKYIRSKVITTCVYDHLALDPDGPDGAITPNLFIDEASLVDSYYVSSKRLWKLYSSLNHLRIKPDAIITDGVDTTKFHPENLERLRTINQRTTRFGWVGNSKWQVNDLKGMNTVIKPAIEQLQAEGYPVELITSDRDKRMIPHNEMPRFYGKIDCYLCASLCEGTPNPVLEAMACGVPIITTDVGLIPELFGDRQKQYILKERSVEAMKEAIRTLLSHPEHFQALSEENLQQIKAWDWSICARRFVPYWEKLLEEKQQ